MRLSYGLFNLALSLLLLPATVFGAERQSPGETTAPMSSPPGGPLNNAVDLSSGKVAYTIPLASLTHPVSPHYSLTLSYSNQVQSNAQIWNTEAPVSNTGAGWSLLGAQDYITRFTNDTGYESDDVFYWSTGGQFIELVYERSDTDGGAQVDHYSQKNLLSNTQISYTYGSPGYWQIIDSNGIKHLYGGSYGKEPRPASATGKDALSNICQILTDNSYKPNHYRPAGDCDTGAVEYGVRWGNWIGPSYQSKNQSQFEMVWHKSAIEDIWGNKTLLSYARYVQNVGDKNGAKRFSKAAYLYKVTQTNSQQHPVGSLVINYCARNKGASGIVNTTSGNTSPNDACLSPGAQYQEFIDPWTINQEPDGYQERLRTLYINSIDTYSQSQTRLETVELDYMFLTSGDDADMAKRVLTAIQHKAVNDADGTFLATSPTTEFSYWGQDSDDGVSVSKNGMNMRLHNPANGALYGALKTITAATGGTRNYTYKANALTHFTRDVKLPGDMRNRQVVFGSNYALVMGKGQSFVYTWTAIGWQKTTLAIPVQYATDGTPIDTIAMQDDFFAYIGTDGLGYMVQRETKNGLWQEPIPVPQAMKSVVTLKDVIVFLRKSSGYPVAFRPDGTNILDAPVPKGFGKVDKLVAFGDYIVGYYAANSNVQINAAVYDAVSKQWQTPISLSMDVTESARNDFCLIAPPSPFAFNLYNACGYWMDLEIADIQPFANHITLIIESIRMRQKICTTGICRDVISSVKGQGGKIIQFSDDRKSLIQKNPISRINQLFDNDLDAASNSAGFTSNSLVQSHLYSVLSMGADSSSEQGVDQFQWGVKSLCHTYTYNGDDWVTKYVTNVHNTSKRGTAADFKFLHCASAGNSSVDFQITANGQNYREYRLYDPKSETWRDTGNQPDVPPAPQRKKNKIKTGLGIFEKILGTIFTLGGLSDFPVGTLISATFIGLDIADSLLKDSYSKVSPLSLSLSQHYINDGNALRYRLANGEFADIGTLDQGLPAGGELISRKFGQLGGYIPFTLVYPGSKYKSYIRLLRNGSLGPAVWLNSDRHAVSQTDDKYATSNRTMFISYSDGSKLQNSTGSWFLYRVAANDATWHITDYVVDQVQVKNVDNTYKTGYSFDASQATFNGMGVYGKASVYPGAVKSAQGQYVPEYGHVEYLFFNGLSDQDINVCTIGSNCKAEPALQYNQMLTGRNYQRSDYDAAGKVTFDQNYQYKIDVSADGKQYHVAPESLSVTHDGVQRKESYSYNNRQQRQSVTTTTQSYNPVTQKTQNNLVTHHYRYAWEKYPTMLSSNQLNALYKSYTTEQSNDEAAVTRTGQLYSYKDWGQNRWLPDSNYRLYMPEKDPTSLTPDLSQYIKAMNIDTRQAQSGLPVQAHNSDGLLSQIWYSTDGNTPYASFTHASANAMGKGDAGYFGAEPYEPIWLMNPSVRITTVAAYTGNHALRGQNNTASGFYLSPPAFTPDSDRDYRVGAWVKTQADSSCTVTMGSQQQHSKANNDWQYIEVTGTPGTTSSSHLLSCAHANDLVDDFRYGPVDSTFSANVYDLSQGFLMASLGMNGRNHHHQYDEFRQPYLSYQTVENSAKQQFTGFAVNGYARFAGFDRSLGNSAASATIGESHNTTLALSFRDKDTLHYEDAATLQQSTIGQLVLGNQFAFHSQIQIDNTQINRLSIGSQLSPLLSLVYAPDKRIFTLQNAKGQTQSSATLPANPTTLTWVVIDQAVWVYANGKLLISVDDFAPSLNDSNAKLNNKAMTLAKMVFGKNPNLRMTYYDALGRSQQRQTLHQNTQRLFSTVVDETLYDGWGNLALRTKTAAYTPTPKEPITLFGYKDQFVSHYDWTTDSLTGDVVNYYQTGAGANILHQAKDALRPYIITHRENAPTQRVAAQTVFPGNDFRIDNSQRLAMEASYQSSSSTTWMQSLNMKASEFFGHTRQMPFAVNTAQNLQTITNLQGRHVISRSGNKTQGYIQSATQYEFGYNPSNIAEHRRRSLQPSYFSQLAGHEQYQTITTAYDLLGLLSQKSEPDVQGEHWLIRNQSGRVRFYRQGVTETEGKASGLSYKKYDTLGRVTEEGVLKNISGDFAFYQQKSSDVNFPAPNQACVERRYHYDQLRDSTRTYINYQGRLAYVEVVQDNIVDNPTTTCQTTTLRPSAIYYQYDTNGLITAVAESNGSTRRTTGYRYDNLGNLLILTYPTIARDSRGLSIEESKNGDNSLFQTDGQAQVHYSYDSLGRLSDLCDSADCKRNGTVFTGGYQYDINGHLLQFQSNNGRLQTTYVYDFQGRLLASKTSPISSPDTPLLREQLAYDTRTKTGTLSSYQGGNITKASYSGSTLKSDHAYDEDYQYDLWGRLIKATRQQQNNKKNTPTTTTYSYDANNNLKSQSIKNSNTADDFNLIFNLTAGTNQLSNITQTNNTQPITHLSTNTRGAVTEITTQAKTPVKALQLQRHAHNNQLLAVITKDDTVNYQYDALGRRVLKAFTHRLDTTTLYYGISVKPLLTSTDLGQHRLIYHPNGQLLAQANDTDDTFYALLDHLNSTRAVVNATNQVKAAWTYTPFGRSSQIVSDKSNAKQTQLALKRFAGHAQDEETGLYYTGARYYTPDYARFLSLDPARLGASPYTYVANNPVNFVDPSGAMPVYYRERTDAAYVQKQNRQMDQFSSNFVGNRHDDSDYTRGDKYADAEPLAMVEYGFQIDVKAFTLPLANIDDYLITVDNDSNIIYANSGKKVNTPLNDGSQLMDLDDETKYTMNSKGDIFVFPGVIDNEEIKHSQGAVKNAIAAGDIQVKDGKLVLIDENSGHFMPSRRVGFVIAELQDRGLQGNDYDIEARTVASDFPRINLTDLGKIHGIIDAYKNRIPPELNPSPDSKPSPEFKPLPALPTE